MTPTLPAILALPCIGEGNFRRVYRDGPNVYKVEYGEGITYGSNRAEFANVRSFWTGERRLPNGVSVPAAYLFETDGVPVITMPYIEGVTLGECFCIPGEAHEGCLPPGIERDLNTLGIDLAYGNVILSGTTYFIVDLDADLR